MKNKLIAKSLLAIAAIGITTTTIASKIELGCTAMAILNI